jgi:2-succinyl-5-enolpyruvyl-6-hydroxy-3-cyclohexene-1-carboxylate synthase
LTAVTRRNDAFVSVLVAALHASGVRHACVSPGSRNTPLSLAFAAHPGITDWSHQDERSGSFFGIGLAVSTGTPVVVVTTSGTAAAELHPAAIEADSSGVPLVLLTADRPTELYDVAAPQTIDQRSLFGGVVRWHHDLDVPEPADMPTSAVAALAARLVMEATAAPPGPVHLNVRFREPLIIDAGTPEVPTPQIAAGAPGLVDPGTIDAITARFGPRGIVVAGPSRDVDLPGAAIGAADALGWPILADPISGLRAGDHAIDSVVGSDLLAASGLPDHLGVDTVIRVGSPPTSKALRGWLAATDATQIVVAPTGWPDPDSSGHVVLRAAPGPTLRLLADRAESADPAWRQQWKAADKTALEAARGVMGTTLSEPMVALALARSAPDGAAIWTASSMPIRDVDSFFPVTRRPLRLLGNRGANGIDGLASTALGSAATRTPTIAHLGDLSMLHDVGSLATAARLDLPITLVVVNNDGGGIFHFLPQAGHEHFERHFGTPHGLSFRDIAEGFGIEAVVPESVDDLETAIRDTGDRPRLVEVRTDRFENATIHREIAGAVREALIAV